MGQAVHLTRDLGMLRIAAAIPPLRVADVDFNIAGIIAYIHKAREAGVQVLTFPEMAVTGYTIADLVTQQALLTKAREGLRQIMEQTAGTPMLIAVGLPLEVDQKVFNCAAVIGSGRLLGVVPKNYLPTYKEFYESRWFTSGREAASNTVELAGQSAPFGTDILFALRGMAAAVIGVEVCEDLWVPLSPHEYQAVGGATVLLNLSASNEIIGKADWRRTMILSESGRCIAAYCYTSCGIGESSNDVVFSGHALIAENGSILTESDRLAAKDQMIVADVDLERLANDRRSLNTFRRAGERPFRTVECEVADPPAGDLRREVDPHPFVPADPARRAERCRDIFAMQVAALAQKLTGAHQSRIVLGVSGGLDSSLALLVAVKTMDFLELPRTGIHAYSLPGFGTTPRTRSNATRLSRALGVSLDRVNINRTCRSHLKDLGHEGQEDIVFENVQARYRTEFLFNKANDIRAIVLGTGDLTEVALGWATFSGDHLSHYHVNTSVPKTLVRYLVRWVADEEMAGSPAQKALYDILDTPISPELRRLSNGEITQKSEETIGPVELADFYLYPFVRLGTRPGKILYLANEARKRDLFEARYTLDDLRRWLQSFLQRFFANQFKRTCFPEGPKIGSVSLSPRGDWRMPSEAEARLWLDDMEAMYRRLDGVTGPGPEPL